VLGKANVFTYYFKFIAYQNEGLSRDKACCAKLGIKNPGGRVREFDDG